jgi:hypothetical protein
MRRFLNMPRIEAGTVSLRQANMFATCRQIGDEPAQTHDFVLDGRDCFWCGLREVGNPAELGAHARGGYHAECLTGGERRAGEDHVGQLCGSVFRRGGIGLGAPGLWQRLSCERRVVYLDVEGFDQPTIGRYVIAFRQLNDIPGDKICAREIHLLAIAAHADQLGEESLQRRHRLVRTAFLPEREQPVDEDHRDDGRGEGAHAGSGAGYSATGAKVAAAQRMSAKK